MKPLSSHLFLFGLLACSSAICTDSASAADRRKAKTAALATMKQSGQFRNTITEHVEVSMVTQERDWFGKSLHVESKPEVVILSKADQRNTSASRKSTTRRSQPRSTSKTKASQEARAQFFSQLFSRKGQR